MVPYFLIKQLHYSTYTFQQIVFLRLRGPSRIRACGVRDREDKALCKLFAGKVYGKNESVFYECTSL